MVSVIAKAAWLAITGVRAQADRRQLPRIGEATAFLETR
jgi:hypothetical protein